MTKENVLSEFNNILTDPGSLKSGEYLEAHIIQCIQSLIKTDRPGLVETIRDWIAMEKEPQTMLAVRAANTVLIHEVRPDIERLRAKVKEGKVFPTFYLKDFDATLIRLSQGNEKRQYNERERS